MNGFNTPSGGLRALLSALHERIEHAAIEVNHLEDSLARELDEVNKLVQKLSASRNELDDLDAAVLYVARTPELIEQHLSADLANLIRDARTQSSKPKPMRQGLEAALRRKARHGATEVEVEWLEDGGCDVLIDSTELTLSSPKLAALFAILIADDGPSEDRFVGWKSKTEVLDRLALRTGATAFKPKVLDNLVWRLRIELERVGLHGDFIQTDRDRGLRFARRSDAAPERSAEAG